MLINEKWVQEHLTTIDPAIVALEGDINTLSKELGLSDIIVGIIGSFPLKFPCTPLEFTNGGSMSVQASIAHHCSPRSDSPPWTHVEIGFPKNLTQDAIDILKEYTDYDPDKIIIERAPITLVAIIANLCGGVTEEIYNHKSPTDGETP